MVTESGVKRQKSIMLLKEAGMKVFDLKISEFYQHVKVVSSRTACERIFNI